MILRSDIFWGAGQTERLGAPIRRPAPIAGFSRWLFDPEPQRTYLFHNPSARPYLGAPASAPRFVAASGVADVDVAFDTELVPDGHVLRLPAGLWHLRASAHTSINTDSTTQAQLRRVRPDIDDLVVAQGSGYTSVTATAPLAGDGAGQIGSTFDISYPYLEVDRVALFYLITRRVQTGGMYSSHCLIVDRLE